MEGYIVEWLNLLGRWVHMITGIAWIGASFYFVWLDNHLQTVKDPKDDEKGVGGELWAVHGGGFYHAQKYRLSPAQLPETLHWFKWEAYTTWITGMFMLVLIYWYGAEVYLIDRSVAIMSKPIAILLGAATIIVGWLVYDAMCKSTLGKNDKHLGIVLFLFICFSAWALCHVFSGRGAYMHFGAMLGTMMVANVFFVIMPGQRALVAAAEKGEAPDPKYAITAKQRSVHNTYFTLPVLFVMISNHYAMTYGHEHNWLILIAISLAGTLIRIYFVQRHFGKNPIQYLVFAGMILTAISLLIAPKPAPKTTTPATMAVTNTTKTTPVDGVSQFAQVQTIIANRCTTCHSTKPTQPGFYAPPKGIAFDTAENIAKQAALINQQSVLSKAMPIGNLTKMTETERTILGSWFNNGAKMD